jgi:dolichol-phosphate mannosyltransferase
VADSVVIIPTYNEKENIEKIIRKVFSLEKDFDVLIVEDNSPDGTADIVKSLMKEFPQRLFIEERRGKLGLGTAYIHGFRWALERGYSFVTEMDADFSHNPEDLLRLYDVAKNKNGDVVVGSRYITGVNVVNWPIGRVLMSYYASAYVRFVTRIKVRDTTAGFVCYRAEVLKALDLGKIKFTGYAFQETRVQHRGGADHLHRPHHGGIQDEQGDLQGGHSRGHHPPPQQPVQQAQTSDRVTWETHSSSVTPPSSTKANHSREMYSLKTV